MQIINFFDSEQKSHWLEEIKKSDWNAGAFLNKIIVDGTYPDLLGKGLRVLLLTDSDRLVSYCTFAEKDDIQPTELTPWIGFVYTFPEFRGRRFAGLLFDEAVCKSYVAGYNDVSVTAVFKNIIVCRAIFFFADYHFKNVRVFRTWNLVVCDKNYVHFF